MTFETFQADAGPISVKSLPTGGGAIRGIGEAFKANPATGTVSLSIPLPFSSARALSPSHSLSYDSGAGNGIFGLGWSLDLPQVTRRTDRRLPTYDDACDSFALNGAELVPVLKDGVPVILASPDGEHLIRRFRKRAEGAFDRIEMWRHRTSGQSHWRVWSAANIVLVFGMDAAARVADPANPARVSGWYVQRVFDQLGNLTLYSYRGDTTAQVYPHRIFYGNRTPYRGDLPEASDFCFCTRFDYGETAPLTAGTEPVDWPERTDALSRFRTGFELRTKRLCTRVILEHRFPELGTEPEQVRSLDLAHEMSPSGVMRLTVATSVGYRRESQSDPFEVEHLPPLRLIYSDPEFGTEVRAVTGADGRPVPVAGQGEARWIDLHGTALPGLLSTTPDGMVFQENLGRGRLGPPRAVTRHTALAGEVIELADAQGRGRKQMAVSLPGLEGYFQSDLPQDIAPFRAVDQALTSGRNDPNLRPIDLTGNGIADRLRTDGDHLVWYRADEAGGFDAGQRVSVPIDGHRGAAFVFADPAGLTYLADMSGDGLLDIVQVRARGVRYWPNLGYGRFAPAIDMHSPPALTAEGDLNPAHLRLVDLNGNGLTDILRIGADGLTLYPNLAGNGFGPAQDLGAILPGGIAANDVAVIDILGQGTVCLSWSGRHSAEAAGKRLYVDLFGGVKPDLLTEMQNGFGGVTKITYRPSTAYERDAAERGEPWATTLHFPVHCLASTRMHDEVTGFELTSSYSYQHGYFDPEDREFRGFARVDQFDSETVVETGTQDRPRAFFQPTRLTKTWFHTGARLGNRRLEEALAREFYTHPDLPLDPLAAEMSEGLTSHEWTMAQRALKGQTLRTETYVLDDHADSAHPYTIGFGQQRIVLHQRAAGTKTEPIPPVFQSMARQAVSVVLDRNPTDPRLSQSITLEWDSFGTPLRQVSVAHGRWGDPVDETPNDVLALQRKVSASLSEQRLTEARDPSDATTPLSLLGAGRARHLPKSHSAETWEIRGLSLAPRTLTDAGELEERIAALPTIAFTDHDSPAGRRRIAAARSFFTDASLSAALPLGEVGPVAIVHHTETLALNEDSRAAIYGDRVTASELSDARYIRDDDDSWWVPSGTTIHSDAPEDRFYLPLGARDIFETESKIWHDDHLLAVVRSENVLGHQSRAVIDYRLLAPSATQDPNGNWSVAAFSPLGLIRATAMMGKIEGSDPPDGTEPCEGSTLDRPSMSFEYDLHAWIEGRGPARSSQTAYVTHGNQDAAGARETIVSHDYMNGLGEIALSKVQAAPGPAQRIGPEGALEEIDTRDLTPPALRWIGNGRTILNNAGQPLRQWEPYFSTTPDYEDDAALVEQGISSLPFYDAAGRPVGALHPDGTWEKTRHSPWRSEVWDASDTCLLDPMTDPDLAAHFEGLPSDLSARSWHQRRAGGERGAEAVRAAEKSAAHAGTPSVSHLDALGRPILSIADTGGAGKIETRTRLDIEGNMLSVHDGLGRAVEAYLYNCLPPPDDETPKPALRTDSMDQGMTQVFADAAGRALLAWNALGARIRTEHDILSRPVATYLQPTGEAERRTSFVIHGDAAPEAAARNLIGQVWIAHDTAGRMETGALDFQGNMLWSSQQLLAGDDDAPDWPDDPEARAEMLSDEVYVTRTSYDALGRVTRSELPHLEGAAPDIQIPVYDAGGALAAMDVQVAGGPVTRVLAELTHDAKGQRLSARLGNGVETRYAYDPETYRLTRLVSTGPGGTALQDLTYTYDATGNAVAIRDATQPVLFHNNAQIEPVARYTYDAIGRLTEATGREHIQQTGAPDWQSGLTPRGQVNDLTQLRPYTQTYEHDSAGNLKTLRHVAEGGSWTRHFGYDTESNRLIWANLGRNDATGADLFAYNAAGTMEGLSHLGAMRLNADQQMVEVDLGGGGVAHYTYGAGGTRIRKRIRRQGGAVEERIYLGALEVFRKWSASGALVLRRETHHVADDAGTIALFETQTHDVEGEIAAPDRIARYQLGNHLGSVSLEVDEAGGVITREEHHPYGTTAFFASAPGRALPPKRYRYTGKEKDEETGLHYHGARYYAPWLLRWTAADPIGIAGGLNVFEAFAGNPVNLSDPNGNTPARPPPVRRGSTGPAVWTLPRPSPIPVQRANPPPPSTFSWGGVPGRGSGLTRELSVRLENLRETHGDWFTEPSQSLNVASRADSPGGASWDIVQNSHYRAQRSYDFGLIRNASAVMQSSGPLTPEQSMQLIEFAFMRMESVQTGYVLNPHPNYPTATRYIAEYTHFRTGGGTLNFLDWVEARVPARQGQEPHELEAIVLRDGVPILAGRFVSGAQGRYPVRTRGDQQYTHTEAQAAQEFLVEFVGESSGGLEAVFIGQLPPCAGCQSTMNFVDSITGVPFTYRVSGHRGEWNSGYTGGATRTAIANLAPLPPSSMGSGLQRAPQPAQPGALPMLPPLLGGLALMLGYGQSSETEPLPVPLPAGPAVTNPRY